MQMFEAGDILVRRGLLDIEQLQKLRSQSLGGRELLSSAIAQGMVEEEPALRALGEELGMEFVDLRNAAVDLEVVKNFPQKLRLEWKRKQRHPVNLKMTIRRHHDEYSEGEYNEVVPGFIKNLLLPTSTICKILPLISTVVVASTNVPPNLKLLPVRVIPFEEV